MVFGVATELGKTGYFFKAKPVEALITLSTGKTGWYASLLAKKTDCTFPHMTKVLLKFELLGLVSFKLEGRKKIVSLSAKGRQLAADFSKAVSLFK